MSEKTTNQETTTEAPKPKSNSSVLIGAAFLMATSAIGPGFLTQTSTFTARYLASFSFVIVCVIIMDMVAQVNTWSVIGVSGLRGQEVANKVVPGLGIFLAILVSLGGLAFNIGNVGGVALGLNAMTGLDETFGSILAGAVAICIFLSKNAKAGMDKIAQILGGIIICVILYVCFTTSPPVGDALMRVFTPENPADLVTPMLTLLGGSCGGYIMFSGAHRLLDAGLSGTKDVSQFRRSVLTGISVSGTVRVGLFLAVLGVCTSGGVVLTEVSEAIMGASNPAAEAFRQAAGDIGYRLFGLALASAGTTSVIGAAYTSVSFLKTLHPKIAENEQYFIVGFIAFSTFVMAVLGGAASMVIVAGAVNGLILPISLACMLLASRNPKIVGEEYKHPVPLMIAGWFVVALSGYLGLTALPNLMKLFA